MFLAIYANNSQQCHLLVWLQQIMILWFQSAFERQKLQKYAQNPQHFPNRFAIPHNLYCILYYELLDSVYMRKFCISCNVECVQLKIY